MNCPKCGRFMRDDTDEDFMCGWVCTSCDWFVDAGPDRKPWIGDGR